MLKARGNRRAWRNSSEVGVSCVRKRSHTSLRLRGERSSRLLSVASARASGLLASLSKRSRVPRLAASARSERSKPRQAGLLWMRRCSREASRSLRASAKLAS
ncbi:hypothetical protein D3C76_1497350 [compost metagenome]